MPKTKVKITKELKENAIEEWKKTNNMTATAKKFQVSTGSLRNWVKAFKKPETKTTGKKSVEKTLFNKDYFGTLVEKKRRLEIELADVKASLIQAIG